MRRWLFNIASLVSFLLLVATIVAWAGSRTNTYDFGAEKITVEGEPLWEVGVQASNRVWLIFNRSDDPTWNNVPAKFHFDLSHSSDDEFANLLPFWEQQGFVYDRNIGELGLPYWFVSAATLLLPAAWLGNRGIRRQRSVQGICIACSYDLTGNASGVCPECGSVVKAS